MIFIVIIFVIYRFIIRPFRQGLNSGYLKKVVIKEPLKTVNKNLFLKREMKHSHLKKKVKSLKILLLNVFNQKNSTN